MSILGFIVRKVKKSSGQRKRAKKVSATATKSVKVDKEIKKLSYQAALKNIRSSDKIAKKKKRKKTPFSKRLKKAYKAAKGKRKKRTPLIDMKRGLM